MPNASAASPTAWLRIALPGSIAIVLFDVVAAFASRGLGFRYANASFGSWLIYLVIGYLAARHSGKLMDAALAAGASGIVEATLGWWLSSRIVPLQVPLNAFSATAIIITVLIVALTAAGIGSVGGLAGRRSAGAGAGSDGPL